MTDAHPLKAVSTPAIAPPGVAATYLFVVPWDTRHVGGVNGVVINLVQAMQGFDGLAPRIAVNDWSARTPCERDGQWRFRFSLLGALRPAGLLGSLVRAPVALVRLWRLLRQQGVQVVNFHYLNDAALGVALLRLAGVYRGRLVISMHGADVAMPSAWLHRVAIRLCLRAADAIIVVSRGLAQRAVDQLGVPASRLKVIANGVDHGVFRPEAAHAASGLPALPARYLVSVGRYIPRKDHGCTIRAFALLAAERPDLDLCIAGDASSELEGLRSLCVDLGVAGRVHFLQSLPAQQVAELLARAQLFVQASHSEGLPLTAIEAAAAGTAMVLSDIPGHDEIVTPGVDGLLFPVGDARACADAVVRLLDDAVLRAQMAERQRRQALERFAWSRCAGEYLVAVGLEAAGRST